MPLQNTRPSGGVCPAAVYAAGGSSATRAHVLLPGVLVISAVAVVVAGPLVFVSSMGSVSTSRMSLITRGAAPALAPTITIPRPDVPEGIDETRYGEQVRWLMDEDDKHPPRWHVLLLDKTFESKANTITRVASCLAVVLGLSLPALGQNLREPGEHHYPCRFLPCSRLGSQPPCCSDEGGACP